MLTFVRDRAEVALAKDLGTGYVRLEVKNASPFWGWAQMPKGEWEALNPGEQVPDEYIFANEAPEMMPRMFKPPL